MIGSLNEPEKRKADAVLLRWHVTVYICAKAHLSRLPLTHRWFFGIPGSEINLHWEVPTFPVCSIDARDESLPAVPPPRRYELKVFCWICHPIIDFLCRMSSSIFTIAAELVFPFLFFKVCEGETPSVWLSRIHIEKLWQHSDENKIKWEQQPAAPLLVYFGRQGFCLLATPTRILCRFHDENASRRKYCLSGNPCRNIRSRPQFAPNNCYSER